MIPSFIDKTKVPHKPGVYIYHNTKGKILYVGKAIDLYHRVASYFSGKQDGKTAALVENIASVETIEVASELEALILEANLIKKHLPPFNIKLTDDKDYLYIKITDEPFPRILTARKKELVDAQEYFGPFPSASVVRITLKRLRRIFPWCNFPPHDGVLPDRPCFYYHLGLCPGACAGKISSSEYNQIIKGFAKFMDGRKEELINTWEKQMLEYSKNQEYEQAHLAKRMLTGLQYLTQSDRVEVYLENPNFIEDQTKQSLADLKKELNLKQIPARIECFDISNIQGKMAVGSLVVLTDGDIDKKWYRRFKIHLEGKPNDVAMMVEMVQRRLKHPEWPKPDLILVDGGRGQVRAIDEVLKSSNWQLPVLGLAKRREWLYTPGEEIIKLSKSSLSLMLLQRIRDEAHRVAINYHRKLRDIDLLYN